MLELGSPQKSYLSRTLVIDWRKLNSFGKRFFKSPKKGPLKFLSLFHCLEIFLPLFSIYGLGHPNKVRTILITQIMNDPDITIFSPAAECREWNGAYWFSLDDLNE